MAVCSVASARTERVRRECALSASSHLRWRLPLRCGAGADGYARIQSRRQRARRHGESRGLHRPEPRGHVAGCRSRRRRQERPAEVRRDRATSGRRSIRQTGQLRHSPSFASWPAGSAAALGDDPPPGPTPPPIDDHRFLIPDVSVFPFRAIGEVFAKFVTDDTWYTCTGALVGHRIVLTTARCLGPGQGRLAHQGCVSAWSEQPRDQ